MRLLVCAGMTGGGMYPALAVLQELENKIESVLWIGSRSGMEESLLAQYQFPFNSISAAGIHGVNLRQLPNNILQLYKGWQESKAIIQDFKPHVIFFTGGFLGVPVSIAGRNIPSVVFIPDIEPGFALKTIIVSSKNIALSTNSSLPFISRKKRVEITGYPLRKEIKQWTRSNGRKHFGIPKRAKTLLVFGGSKGARSINQALLPILRQLIKIMHVVHITGTDNWEDVQQQIKSTKLKNSRKYQPYPYLHQEMGAAFAASDLVICRAGASTIGELPYFGLPAILVPYPHAWRYQYQNAEFLEATKGAMILEDHKMQENLLDLITNLISDEKKLSRMKENIKGVAIQDAAQSISKMILEAGEHSQAGENL